jgi:crotonobetainyl-CoA:carnitine CoA-transferase CaiB-like acyl-CoA transferase
LLEILEAEFARDVATAWLDKFRAAGVPSAPINNYSQVLSDPQVDYMGWVQPIDLPNGVTTKTFASPVRINSQTLDIRMRPPALGEHNEEIFSGITPGVK